MIKVIHLRVNIILLVNLIQLLIQRDPTISFTILVYSTLIFEAYKRISNNLKNLYLSKFISNSNAIQIEHEEGLLYLDISDHFPIFMLQKNTLMISL